MTKSDSAPSSTPTQAGINVPREGMLATVRNRRGLVTAVDAHEGGPDGLVHLVTIEYTDADGVSEDEVVWEREVRASLQEPSALPRVHDEAAMPVADFDALVRAARWGAVTPFVDPDGSDGPLTRLPLVAPFHGAIQVEDFQLVPLLKALRMPRVSLLLADDVGLGKTIEAGLILAELLLRRRVRRVLIVCPASLRTQWRQEMRDKFSILFDEVDRPSTAALRRQLGLDANPWRTHQRIITSYDYLKQPDVLEAFRSASSVGKDSPHLPWDLLIVDEAHNLSPAPYGEESDASQLLGQLAPMFEHKLFLTATPHNGHTRSFSGLLERLDPVRFSRKSDRLSPAEKARVEEVVIRRLKRDINERTKPNERFSNRHLRAVPLYLHKAELALSAAFQEFRAEVRHLFVSRRRGEQIAGGFAAEVLGKRLLSCPAAFADSWWRYREGMNEAIATDAADVRAAERAVREDSADDREIESRTAHAARTVGAWLHPLADTLKPQMDAIDQALKALQLTKPGTESNPNGDARFEALLRWIDDHLRVEGAWKSDERLVIFTEYKTTLDYLRRRLTECYQEPECIQVLYGNMDPPSMRDQVKEAFNAPASPLRVLVATDAASEGLNLQETARYLLHYDVPWNPSRLEQRNGRLDRHGQARDVYVHHFASDDEDDLRFLSFIINKIDAIREDLGSVGEVFDSAFQRRFIEAKDAGEVTAAVDRDLKIAKGRAEIPHDSSTGIAVDHEQAETEYQRLQALRSELDLTPDSLRTTLDVALKAGSALSTALAGPDAEGRFAVSTSLPSEWQLMVNETVRLKDRTRGLGALPHAVFDSDFFIDRTGKRPVFRPRKDTVLLHLGHPLFQRALASFARARFAGASSGASRWTVRQGDVPAGADALLLLTVEELAVNELRESFHHWVRTIKIPVHNGDLGPALGYLPASQLGGSTRVYAGGLTRAREIWGEVEGDVRARLKTLAGELETRLIEMLAFEKVEAIKREAERFRSRQGELSALIQEQTLASLEREVEDLKREQQQGFLFDQAERLAAMASSQKEKEEELRRRKAHYEALRDQLARERTRVLDHLLPRRYALRGKAQVFPVAVEIRLPQESAR
jgi:superfamily II DNA or RNA helicase